MEKASFACTRRFLALVYHHHPGKAKLAQCTVEKGIQNDSLPHLTRPHHPGRHSHRHPRHRLRPQNRLLSLRLVPQTEALRQ